MTQQPAQIQPVIPGKPKRPSSSERSKGIAPIILFALFVVLLLLVLVAGLRSFASEVASSNDSKDARLSVGFIANTVRSLDSSGFIRVGEGPEGEALVLVERVSVGDFETRFYLHNGNLVQEYTPADSPYSPETATVMFATEEFEFYVEKDMLTVSTDKGNANVALRSAFPVDDSDERRDPEDGAIISEEVVLL